MYINTVLWLVQGLPLFSCLVVSDLYCLMDYSILHGFPVLHCPQEYSQTHVHGVNDAIQPSHPLLTPSLLAFHLSQHQGLFQ